MADMTRRVVLELLARNKARGDLASFRSGIDQTFRSVRRMATGVLALAGVGGLGYMLREQAKVIDSTAKLSDRLGLTTESLVGLQHGAQIAGVDTETLNKSLEIFSRRLGEVDMGVGQAHYALEKLGIDYNELINKSPDEAIGIVADQINRLGTQAEKAAAANYLFGRSGQRLLNLFEKGSAGIAEYREEVRKLGLSFSRIDAAKVEAANDALTRTKAVFTGLFRSATIELAPYIEAAATSFNNWATAGEGVGANVTAAFESISIAAIKTANLTKDLRAEWVEYKADLLSIQAVLQALTSPGQFPASPYSKSAQLRAEAKRLREEAKGDITAVQKFYDDLRNKSKEQAQWQEEKTTLNRRLTDVYGPASDQAQDDMNARVQIHEQGMRQIVARESETAMIVRGFQDEAKRGWVTMWDPFIDRSMSAKEAVNDFFANFFIRLAQAKAQMAMLNLWNAAAGGLFGGIGGSILGIGGYTPNYSTAVTNAGVAPNPSIITGIRHSGWVPEGMPDFHGGRAMRADEMVALVKKDELIAPAKQIVRGEQGSAQPTIHIGTYIKKVEATDAASFERQLIRSKRTVNDLQYAGLKSNSPARRFNT